MKNLKDVKAKIIILGSGTCNIEPDKANTSLLIKYNNENIIYDFGYRVYSNLIKLGFSNENISRIIISHSHPDHFCDLIPFLHSCFYSKNKKKNLLYLYSGKEFLEIINMIRRLLPAPDNFNEIVKIKIIKSDGIFYIKDLKIKTLFSNHSSNISIKFKLNDKDIAITGDIDIKKDNLNFFKNTDICFLNSGKLNINEILNLKKLLNIKKLILLHSYLSIKDTDLLQRDNIIIGKDFQSFNLINFIS